MNALIIPMHWTSVDSLNAKLPEGIRLYAGQNDALPLRAWYVTIDEKDPLKSGSWKAYETPR